MSLSSALARFLEGWIPPSLRADPDQLRRARLLVGFALALASTCPPFIALALWSYGMPEVAAITAGGMLLAIAIPVLVRRGAGLAVGAGVLAAALSGTVLGVAAVSEGPASVALSWVALTPLLATLLGGKRAGLGWGAVTLLGVGGLALADRLGLLPDVRLPEDVRRLAAAWNVALLVAMAGVVAFLYESVRDRYVEELARARDQVVKAREDAQMADRLAALGTLAAGFAHEINNPLAYLTSNLRAGREVVERLRAGTASAEEAADCVDALAEASQGADRVQRLVADLLIFSRGEAATVGEIDPVEVFEAALRMVSGTARGKATIVRQLQPVPRVATTELRLGQVLVNLLMNALQAFPARAPEANLLRVATEVDPSGAVVLEVADNGLGMTPDVLARAFDLFFTTKPPGLGTGLGLAVCHRLVASMGGHIEVQSSPETGSLFRVVLPTPA